MANGADQLRVGVIMGSDSDLFDGTMQETTAALREAGLQWNVDYELGVTSAHRTPDLMTEYATGAADRGLQVIIAGAGGSAHLQGMASSETTLPLLGVAVTKRPDTMNRALGSLIGMPKGKPLATFQAHHGAYNAGLFAVRIVNQVGGSANRIAVVDAGPHEHDAMSHAVDALTQLGLNGEVDIDRIELLTDRQIKSFCREVGSRALAGVIVSSSTYHELPREIAAATEIPVLGVAVTPVADEMTQGLSKIVNTDKGVPIAAFQGTAGAYNAGLEAARILGLSNPGVVDRLKEYDRELALSSRLKHRILHRIGDEAYVALTDDARERLMHDELAEITAEGQL